MGTELAFLGRALHEFNVTVTPFSKQISVHVRIRAFIRKLTAFGRPEQFRSVKYGN